MHSNIGPEEEYTELTLAHKVRVRHLSASLTKSAFVTASMMGYTLLWEGLSKPSHAKVYNNICLLSCDSAKPSRVSLITLENAPALAGIRGPADCHLPPQRH